MNINYKITTKEKEFIPVLDNSSYKILIFPSFEKNVEEMIEYLIKLNEFNHISFKILEFIFANLSIEQLYSIGNIVENVLHILLDRYLKDKTHIFQLIDLIEVLHDKRFELIKWTYPYFLNLEINDFNQEEKYKLLIFYSKHSLISKQNIRFFVNISCECDILLIDYYTRDFKKPFILREIHCIHILLKSFFLQCIHLNPIEWKIQVIQFMVICIFMHISLKEFEKEINEMIETLIEIDIPIIVDSISIILAHLSGINLYGNSIQ